MLSWRIENNLVHALYKIVGFDVCNDTYPRQLAGLISPKRSQVYEVV